MALALGIQVWRNRENFEQGENNYKVFFILGVSFLPLGIVLWITTGNPGLIGISGLGAAYIAIGLNNRDKW